MILKDFKCPNCGVKELMCESSETELLCECGSISHSVITKISTTSTNDSFNPHYDLQLGKHFSSKEEKKSFLKMTGRAQLSGPPSPRKSTTTSIMCNKSQSKKEFGLRKLTRKETSHATGSNDF